MPEESQNKETVRSNVQRLVFVTGPSGAGRATAVRALEDIGFEAIDNLPLSLLPRLLDGPPIARPLALGVDVRNRDFSTHALIELIEKLSAKPELDIELLYLDCSADVLIRRFSETRRPHPMAEGKTPALGIEMEFDLLRSIRARANVLIDTTELTPHDLCREIEHWFNIDDNTRMAVSVQSFSYKRGIPRGVDMVFDCRFLRNPHWEPALRKLDGRDSKVAEYVEKDARYLDFFNKVSDLVTMLLPAFTEEGKSHLSIAFGCTGGQHRSVAVAEKLANALAASVWQVSIRHRELERRGVVNSASSK
ncbi:MAG: RNase adapter RapZ [Paracoccaceae bacterium]